MLLEGYVLLDRDLLKKTGVFALVSGELIACIGGGYFLGSWLDSKRNTAPLMTAGISVLGLVYSVWRIFWLSKQWMKPEEKKDL
jgi:hypothetical protein